MDENLLRCFYLRVINASSVESKVVTKDFNELPPGGEGSVDDETDLYHIVGEPVVSGPNAMQGYHGLPEVNAAVLPEEKGKHWC